MKRKFASLVTIILALILSVSVVSGCNLVKRDEDKNYEQVVATINIGNEGSATDEITKKDMVMAYLNYGYMYVYSYGYTVEETFEMILNNLIGNRVLVQNAMKVFEESPENPSIEKWNLKRYLTLEDEVDGTVVTKLSEYHLAEYNSLKTINDYIEQEIKKDELKADTMVEGIRTIPTDATVDDGLTDNEKSLYIAKGVNDGNENGNIDPKVRKAYNAMIKSLKDSNLLGDDFSGDILESEYYQDVLTSHMESILVDKYETKVKTEARKGVSFEMLEERYAEMYEAQQNGYTGSLTEFEKALSESKNSSPVVYSPYTGYVYVYNLLLGVNDEQTASINALKDKVTNKVDYSNARRAVLETVKVKDLRTTWLYSGYDFDFATKTFTGDFTFAKDPANSLAYQGDVTVLNPDREEGENAKYSATSKSMGLSEFVAFMEDYVYGSATKTETVGTGSYYKIVNCDETIEEYDAKINELLFAFSTDEGSLNTYKGYVVSPRPDFDGAETYMQEFADAGRKFVEDGLGKSSYIMVATDYGYHVMFFSQGLGVDSSCSTLVEYLQKNVDSSMDRDAWLTYYADMMDSWDDFDDTNNYLYQFQNLCSDPTTALQNEEAFLIAKYRNDTDYVKTYADRYQDLISQN